MNIRDITITSLETITAFDITSGAYKFTLDELQNATISQTQEKTDITGKQGRKLSSLKRNKAVTISGTNGMVSHGLLELQTGCEFETGVAPVMWVDYLTVESYDEEYNPLTYAVPSYTPVGSQSHEIVSLFLRNADGTVGQRFMQASGRVPHTNEFGYDNRATITDDEVEVENPNYRHIRFLEESVPAGTEIVVYYYRNITADVLKNESDHYSEKCSLYIDAIGEDKCAKQYHVQFYIPKADFNGEFTFEMGDNQTVHSFEAEALSGACGLGGTLWTYTVFGADELDYAEPSAEVVNANSVGDTTPEAPDETPDEPDDTLNEPDDTSETTEPGE